MTTETSTTEFRPSIPRVVAMLLIALVLALSGVALIVWGSGFDRVLGFVTAGLGVLGIPLLAHQLIRRPVMVQLTDTGVQFLQRPFVPWHEIEDVEARTVVGLSRIVVLWLADGAVERLTAGEPPGAAAMRKHSRRFGREALWTPAGVAGGHDRLVAEIKSRLVRVGDQAD